MNRSRILLVAVLSLTATPSFAVPVRFTLEATDFTHWDYAFHDAGGNPTSGNVSDVDNDGLATFDADAGPVTAYIHGEISIAACVVFLLTPGPPQGPFPLFRDPDGNPLIVEFASPPTGPFSLGQTLTATDGIAAGIDGLLHENPGIHTAAALMATGVTGLPTYTGGAVVSGLVTYEVIPEPASWLLLLFTSALSAASCRQIGRRA